MYAIETAAPSEQRAHIAMPGTLLRVQGVSVSFGGIAALADVSFDIQRGEILALIGPNGAGKTTLFNCLSRLYQPSRGDITMEGQSILALPAHRIAELGIGRTFQNVALFNGLTVSDNVRIGTHCRIRTSVVADCLKLRSAKQAKAQTDELVDELIAFLDLREVRSRLVGNLPFGTQKRIELARALAAKPSLLLLDEPACGLNHGEVRELGDVITRICQDRGVTVLLVEHHMGLVMSIADRVVALNFGLKLAEGTPEVVQSHPDVIKAYLGSEQK
jgi:branched-chain amino acid transport system ATP-binding protein